MTDVHQLPIVPRAPPHKFGEQKRVPKDKTISGLEQIEKTCPACGLVKITIMDGIGRRAYRWGNAPFQFDDGFEPECAPTIEEVKSEAAS